MAVRHINGNIAVIGTSAVKLDHARPQMVFIDEVHPKPRHAHKGHGTLSTVRGIGERVASFMHDAILLLRNGTCTGLEAEPLATRSKVLLATLFISFTTVILAEGIFLAL
jgi:hypothetical protein